MLALEQVSVIHEQQNAGTNYYYKASKVIIAKINISVVKTPSSVSMVKISLELNRKIKWKQNNDGVDHV